MKKQIIGGATLALLVGIAGCKSVSVNSTPYGANARSEGQSIGTTPAVVEVNLFSSKKVSLSKDGYAAKTVNVTFNSPASINVSLEREFNVKSTPNDAEVYINGEMQGKTPLEAVAMDDSGATVLEVRKKGWLPAKMTIKSLSTNKLILIAPCAILSSRKNNGGKHGNDKAENVGNNG